MRRHEKRDIWKQATLLENGTPICYWELGAFFSWNVKIFTSFSLVLTALSDSAFAFWNSILLHCIVLCFHESRFPGIYAATQQSRSQSVWQTNASVWGRRTGRCKRKYKDLANCAVWVASNERLCQAVANVTHQHIQLFHISVTKVRGLEGAADFLKFDALSIGHIVGLSGTL